MDTRTTVMTQDYMSDLNTMEEMELRALPKMVQTIKDHTAFDPVQSENQKTDLDSETLLDFGGPPAPYWGPSTTETILDWWIGHVVDINWSEGYFVAELEDLKGIESIAEFDIDMAFDVSSSDTEKNLFKGAEFAFHVVIRHGPGRPITQSTIEFTTPHIWQEEDEEKTAELFRDLFPYDTPIDE